MLNWRIVCCWWTIDRLNSLRTECRLPNPWIEKTSFRQAIQPNYTAFSNDYFLWYFALGRAFSSTVFDVFGQNSWVRLARSASQSISKLKWKILKLFPNMKRLKLLKYQERDQSFLQRLIEIETAGTPVSHELLFELVRFRFWMRQCFFDVTEKRRFIKNENNDFCVSSGWLVNYESSHKAGSAITKMTKKSHFEVKLEWIHSTDGSSDISYVKFWALKVNALIKYKKKLFWFKMTIFDRKYLTERDTLETHLWPYWTCLNFVLTRSHCSSQPHFFR